MPRSGPRKAAGRAAPPGHHSRKVLAVRALAAKTEWITGRPTWDAGRVAWRLPAGEVVRPDAALLARTERSLTRLGQYPAALAQAYPAGWLEERRARWEVVKLLDGPGVPGDLGELAEAARRGEPAAIARLANLLPLEALGAELPVSPAQALAGGRQVAREALAARAAGPEPAAALAALALGAADRAAEAWTSLPRSSPWARACHEWGFARGWPEPPGLVLALLRAAPPDDPDAPAEAWEAWGLLRVIGPDAVALTNWLADGGTAPEVRAYLRALAAVDRQLRRLRRGAEAPFDARPWEKEVIARERRVLPDLAAGLAGQLLVYLPPAPGSAALAGAADLLLEYLLEIGGATVAVAEALTELLEQGADLPPDCRAAYLELVTRQRDTIWDRAQLPVGRRARALRLRTEWFRHATEWHPRALARLLRETEDVESVRVAVDLKLSTSLGRLGWGRDGLLALVLATAREVGGVTLPSVRDLKRLLDCLPAPERRAAAHAMVRAVRGAGELRLHALGCLLDAVDQTREAVRRDLPAVLAAVPVVLQGHAGDDEDCLCEELLRAAALLRREHPRPAAEWLEWVCARGRERLAGGKLEWREFDAFTRAVRLASAFSGGSGRQFRAVFAAAWPHRSDPPEDLFERGLAALRRHEHLLPTLAHAAITTPARCEKLVTAAGLALRLRPDVLDRVATLAPTVADAEALPDLGWRAIVDLSPDALLRAAEYVRARAVLGLDASPPRGVATALELPDRVRREAAHLARRAPDSPGLAARLANLEARLADPDRLRGQAAAEAREKLEQAARTAVLGAIWRLIDDVFRERLDALAGPIPPGLEITPDLLNATLLGVHINSNRGLLKRLLRACLRGDAGWRENHPANAAFLAALAARGVDTEAWLGRHERRVRCAGAPGDRVRIHLETDPLHVLQMGNYFDTCLSFGQSNAYSTVANACELNKRVLYVTDAHGRVVGRKLIAINEDWELVGFRTYSSLADAAQNDALRRTVLRYCRRFARRCGLPLGERGPIARLLTPHWYDDGMVTWQAAEHYAGAPPSASAGEKEDPAE